MKRKYLALTAAAAVPAALYAAYRKAFYSDRGPWTDPFAISPHGEYQARKEEMLTLIAALAERPCERVAITSHDGFERLYGKRADKVRKLYNGMIPCYLYQYFKNEKKEFDPKWKKN